MEQRLRRRRTTPRIRRRADICGFDDHPGRLQSKLPRSHDSSARSSATGTDSSGNTIADSTQCVAGANTTPDNYPIIGDASAQSAAYGSGLYPGVPVSCLERSIRPLPGVATVGPGPAPDFECLPTKIGPVSGGDRLFCGELSRLGGDARRRFSRFGHEGLRSCDHEG